MTNTGPISSVSKGVFVYHGKKSKAFADDYIDSGSNRSSNDCKTRMLIYDSLWEKVNTKIEMLQSSMNIKVFEELLEYVANAHSGFKFGNSELESTGKCPMEIPTAALVTGVNMPDHASMFSNLTSMLKKSVSPHVVVLKSIKCLTIKSVITSTVTQLMDNKDMLDIDEGEEENVVHTMKRGSVPTMSLVVDWYASKYKTDDHDTMDSSPTKKRCYVSFKQLTAAPSPPETVSRTLRSKDSEATPTKSHMTPKKSATLLSPEKNFTSPRKSVARSQLLSPEKNFQSPRKSSRSCVLSPEKNLQTPEKLATHRSDLMSPEKDLTSPKKLYVQLQRLDIASPSPKKLNKCELTSPRKMSKGPNMTSPVRQLFDTDSGSPKKINGNGIKSSVKRSYACLNKPIVVILEDFEGFPVQVLQDFITICSYHLHELPLVMIFGIATTVSAVHRSLPHIVSSLLSMEKFQALPSSIYLSQVLDQILMTDSFPYKLGGKVFDFLLDMFLYHDFSVLNLIQSLRFSMMEHFYSNPSSILCGDESYLQESLNRFSNSQLDSIRSTSSFRRYVENSIPQEQIKLLEDDKFTKKIISRLMKQLISYHSNFYPILFCLHLISCQLPQSPLGKLPRELYAMCLSHNICDTNEYQHAISLIRSLSRDELLACLLKMLNKLEEADPSSDLSGVADEITNYSSKLENLEEMARQVNEDEQEVECIPLPKKTDMFTLKQTLQERDKKKRKLTYFEVVRKEVIDYLDSIFREYLVSPQNLTLHEVFYFNNVDSLRSYINASPRSVTQTALTKPFNYLQNDELRLGEGHISSELPDICIAYKLHLECGRLINLYDWLQAFVTILESGDSDESPEKTKAVDRTKQARFIRSVSELQFLGFIKSTKRKTDHVARLTWGGC